VPLGDGVEVARGIDGVNGSGVYSADQVNESAEPAIEELLEGFKKSGLTGKIWAMIEEEYERMSIDEIINGKEDTFPGLIPLIESYLDEMNVDIVTRCHLLRYLDFIRLRANGTLMTAATWIRKFVREHPEYKHDSVISQGINYDLIRTIEKLVKGEVKIPELMGRFV